METEMELETHFALGIQFSECSGYLDVQFPFRLMLLIKVVFPLLSFNFCVHAQECVKLWTKMKILFVSSSRGSAFPPTWSQVSQLVYSNSSITWGRGEVFVLACVAVIGKPLESDEEECYSCMSSLIMCTSWLSIKSLFFSISCWYLNKHRDFKNGRTWDLAGWKAKGHTVTWRLWWEPAQIHDSLSVLYFAQECS